MEKEKLKREGELKKLRIRKAIGLKYASIPKKSKILQETKSTEIYFSWNPVNQNINQNLESNDKSKNNLNNSSGEQNNQNKENKTDNVDNNEKIILELFTKK